MENLPPELRRQIASQLSPKSLRALSRSSHPKRREMPIGLASLSLRPPLVSVKRPPALNRSIARASTVPVMKTIYKKLEKETSPLPLVLETLNKYNPVAYKNKNWKFYTVINRGRIVFYNSPKGVPFLIKKNGKRYPVPLRGYQPSINQLKARKKIHTWDNYLKRVEFFRKYAKGSPQRKTKQEQINKRVNNYLNGKSNSIENIPLSDMIWWARRTRWMNPHNFKLNKGYWKLRSKSGNNKLVTWNSFLNHMFEMESSRNRNNNY